MPPPLRTSHSSMVARTAVARSTGSAMRVSSEEGVDAKPGGRRDGVGRGPQAEDGRDALVHDARVADGLEPVVELHGAEPATTGALGPDLVGVVDRVAGLGVVGGGDR